MGCSVNQIVPLADLRSYSDHPHWHHAIFSAHSSRPGKYGLVSNANLFEREVDAHLRNLAVVLATNPEDCNILVFHLLLHNPE